MPQRRFGGQTDLVDPNKEVSSKAAKLKVIDLKSRLGFLPVKQGSDKLESKYGGIQPKKFDLLQKFDRGKTQKLTDKADSFVESLFFRYEQVEDAKNSNTSEPGALTL